MLFGKLLEYVVSGNDSKRANDPAGTLWLERYVSKAFSPAEGFVQLAVDLVSITFLIETGRDANSPSSRAGHFGPNIRKSSA